MVVFFSDELLDEIPWAILMQRVQPVPEGHVGACWGSCTLWPRVLPEVLWAPAPLAPLGQ